MVGGLLHVWQEEEVGLQLWGSDVLMTRETWNGKEQRLRQRERREWKVVLHLMMDRIEWYHQLQSVS